MKPINTGSWLYLQRKQDWFVYMLEWMGFLVSDVDIGSSQNSTWES